jgi:stage V sporulation protein B
MRSSTRVGVRTLSYASLSIFAVTAGGLVFRTVTYRVIGPRESGLLALALSVINLAGTVVTLGIPVAIVRYLAARSSARDGAEYLTTGATILLVHSVVVAIATAVVLPSISAWTRTPELVGVRWYIAAGIALSGFLSYWDSSFNGLMVFGRMAALDVTNNLVRILAALGLLAWWKADARTALLAVTAGYLVANLWGVELFSSAVKEFGLRFHVRCASALYRFGAFQFGTMIVEQAIYNSGILLTARFLGPSEVGLFSAASVLAQGVWVLPSALQTITYPLMTGYWSNRDHLLLQRTIDFSLRASLVTTVPAVFSLVYLRREVILVVFGARFIPAADPLMILLIGYLFSAVVSRPVGSAMGAVGRPGIDLVRAAIAGSANLILTLTLIPIWGLRGAAWALTATLIIVSCLAQYFLITRASVRIPAGATRSCLVLGIASAALFALPVPSGGYRILMGCFGTVALAGVGWKWSLHAEDRAYIRERAIHA